MVPEWVSRLGVLVAFLACLAGFCCMIYGWVLEYTQRGRAER